MFFELQMFTDGYFHSLFFLTLLGKRTSQLTEEIFGKALYHQNVCLSFCSFSGFSRVFEGFLEGFRMVF